MYHAVCAHPQRVIVTLGAPQWSDPASHVVAWGGDGRSGEGVARASARCCSNFPGTFQVPMSSTILAHPPKTPPPSHRSLPICLPGASNNLPGSIDMHAFPAKG